MEEKNQDDSGIVMNIEIPMFRIVVNVAMDKTCADAISLNKQIDEYFNHFKEESKSWFGAYIYNTPADIHAIVLSEDVGVETIAHECFHAVMHLLNLKGIRYSSKSEECFAYVLGYLVGEVHKVVDQYKKGAKK